MGEPRGRKKREVYTVRSSDPVGERLGYTFSQWERVEECPEDSLGSWKCVSEPSGRRGRRSPSRSGRRVYTYSGQKSVDREDFYTFPRDLRVAQGFPRSSRRRKSVGREEKSAGGTRGRVEQGLKCVAEGLPFRGRSRSSPVRRWCSCPRGEFRRPGRRGRRGRGRLLALVACDLTLRLPLLKEREGRSGKVLPDRRARGLGYVPLLLSGEGDRG